MKKVLFICSSFPWPPTDGERLRTFNLLRELAKKTDLTIAHPGPAALPEPFLKALKCSVKWQPYQKRPNNLITKAIAFLSLTPVFYKMAKAQAIVKWMGGLEKGAFDVIHLDGLPAFNYYSSAINITSNVVLDLRDSWSLLYRRMYETNGRKMTQLIKGSLVGRIEAKIIQRCSKLVLISSVDEKHIRSRYPETVSCIRVIPNGVSEEFLGIAPRRISANEPAVAFTGAMDYAPNAQAAVFFAQQVVPLLTQKHPQLKFFIVGKNPGNEILNLVNESVVVTGEVPSVANYLNNVDIVVAPLLSGAGMKNKVLEALAASRPVVASKVAVEGIEIADEQDYLLADSVEQWVNAVDRLLLDPAYATRLGESGRAQIAANYSWTGAGQALNDLYGKE